MKFQECWENKMSFKLFSRSVSWLKTGLVCPLIYNFYIYMCVHPTKYKVSVSVPYNKQFFACGIFLPVEWFSVLLSWVMGKKEVPNFFGQVECWCVFICTLVMVSIYMQVTCISLNIFRIIVWIAFYLKIKVRECKQVMLHNWNTM